MNYALLIFQEATLLTGPVKLQCLTWLVVVLYLTGTFRVNFIYPKTSQEPTGNVAPHGTFHRHPPTTLFANLNDSDCTPRAHR